MIKYKNKEYHQPSQIYKGIEVYEVSEDTHVVMRKDLGGGREAIWASTGVITDTLLEDGYYAIQKV